MKTLVLLFWIAVTLIGFGYFFAWIGPFFASPFVFIIAIFAWIFTSAGSQSSAQ